MAFADLLQHTATVYRQVNSIDASGGSVRTWIARTSGTVPCLIRGMSGQEQAVYAQRNIFVTHIIYLLANAAQTGDKVIDANGNTYMLDSIQIQQGVGNIDTFYFWIGREFLPGD
jgi:hypothetical protein